MDNVVNCYVMLLLLPSDQKISYLCFIISYMISKNSCFYISKNVDSLVFNLTAALNRLYATWPLIPEFLSVFIIEGFSPCLKRLIPLHPGCQGCLNFSKLSLPLFSQRWQKKAITKIAVFFPLPLCLSSLSSVHSVLNKGETGLTKNRFSLSCFFCLLFLSTL